MSEGRTGAGGRLPDELIIVALGGNLRAAGASCRTVLDAVLQALPEAGIEVAVRSRYWRSAAWPDAADPPFLNLVAAVETRLGAEALLDALHRIEAGFGRTRTRTRTNAPRTVDLDLIAFGREVRSESPILPHPRASARLFVMGPLAEIAPDWRHPQSGERAIDLARTATVGRDATPLADGRGDLQTR